MNFDSVTAMKYSIEKKLITVEHHCLDLVYAPIRLQRRGCLQSLMTSIEQHGQLIPVIVVEKEKQQWVLMDGYLRIKALRQMGQDTARAEVWQCSKEAALLALLVEHQSRPWEAIEEALLLRELQSHHQLSQRSISAYIGRDKSWVNRRLSLIEHLPEEVVEAILKGKIRIWSAQRVLAPLARANASHSQALLAYLLKNHLTTRELQFFYDHYQQSHRQERIKMMNDLDLFFKAQRLIRAEQSAKKLKAGPEGQWQRTLNIVTSNLKALVQLAPQVLYARQAPQEGHQLLACFTQAKIQFDLLTEKLGNLVDVKERPTPDSTLSTSKREKLPIYQSTP